MIPKVQGMASTLRSKRLIIIGLGLVLSAGPVAARAQQDQPNYNQNNNNDVQEQRNDAPPPDGQMPPRPYPNDQQQQNMQQQQAPPPQAQGQSNQPAPPDTLTLPAGTVVRVRIDDWISTDRNVTGDSFSASLDQPLVVNGWVVARRGQSQTGRVSLVKKGGHGNGNSQLGVDLPDLTLVDGQQLPLQTELFQTSAGSSAGRNAATVGTTTGLGAVIGAIAGGGTGAAIGAGIGATAGIAGVMSTPGKPTVISPETVLSFRLKDPVTISTVNSQFAFQPVSQSDLDSNPRQSRPQMRRPAPPPYYGYPYANYGYPYGYGYGYGYPYGWYPAPVIGFGYYGGYGRFGGFRR
jgi:hypothetical protein